MRLYRGYNGWLECDYLEALIIQRMVDKRERVRITGAKLLRHTPTIQTKVIREYTKLYLKFRPRHCVIGRIIQLPEDR
jgi:hypothetical protein